MPSPDPTQTPPRDAVPADPAAEAAVLLQRLTLLFVLQGAPDLAQRPLRTPWTGDTPVVAAAVAGVLTDVPEAFPYLPITPAILTREIAEAQEALEIKQAIEKLQRWATARLAQSREKLFDHTQTALQSVRSAREGHVVPAEVRAKLEVASVELDAALKTRSDGLKLTRRDREDLRAQGDERVAEVEGKLAARELELSITRGGTADAPATLAARSARKRPAGRRGRR
jgi:hypothetical protein